MTCFFALVRKLNLCIYSVWFSHKFDFGILTSFDIFWSDSGIFDSDFVFFSTFIDNSVELQAKEILEKANIMLLTKQISNSNRNDRSEMIVTTGNVFEEVSSERCWRKTTISRWKSLIIKSKS